MFLFLECQYLKSLGINLLFIVSTDSHMMAYFTACLGSLISAHVCLILICENLGYLQAAITCERSASPIKAGEATVEALVSRQYPLCIFSCIEEH